MESPVQAVVATQWRGKELIFFLVSAIRHLYKKVNEKPACKTAYSHQHLMLLLLVVKSLPWVFL